eukprot:682404-Pyramimonas_sp.AAC.1
MQAARSRRTRLIKDAFKVQAHQSLADDSLTDQERWARLGNDFADRGAKAVLELHERDDDAHRQS